MIKKFLLLILVILLSYGVFSSWAHGVNMKLFNNNIQTHSYAKLIENANTLVSERNRLETKNTTEFNQAVTRQNLAISMFEKNKQEYDSLATQASVEEIRQANQKEQYYLDYLWMKIGTYANDGDIKVLITPNYSNSTITFDVSGQYIAVINFIYDLEKDPDLMFNIDNLVMQGGSSSAVTKAHFMVGNITIITSETEAAN